MTKLSTSFFFFNFFCILKNDIITAVDIFLLLYIKLRFWLWHEYSHRSVLEHTLWCLFWLLLTAQKKFFIYLLFFFRVTKISFHVELRELRIWRKRNGQCDFNYCDMRIDGDLFLAHSCAEFQVTNLYLRCSTFLVF